MRPMLILVAALAVAQQASGPIRFTDVTAASGINFVHSFGAEKLGTLVESTGSGAVWFDYNNDGLLDLYVTSGRQLETGMHPYPLRKPPAQPTHNHLYRNDGHGKFTDVTEKARVATALFSTAATAADFDNDGNTDLFVAGYGGAVLFRNRGDGTFEDVSAKGGIRPTGWTIGSAWLDYDHDGCVDLFVGRYVKFDPKYRAYYAADNYPGPLDYPPDTNLLYKNNCNGTFTDVSEQSGIGRLKGRAMGVTAADFDGDGYPDIYVANDKTENFLFHNEKNGTFKEIAVAAGVAYGQNGENTSAMGPVFLDFEGRGQNDLWVSDSKYNRLMKNVGKLKFEDVTEPAGISQLAAQYVSWGTGAHDFDNDGLPDLFIVHGGLVHMVPQEHSVFRNVGGGKFEDVSQSAGPFFDVKSVGRGAAFADYDNDGKVDGFVLNLGSPAFLLHNDSPGTNHWISIKLVGKKSNRDAIGAVVEIVSGGKTQRRERITASGYLSQDDPRVQFGLGSAAKVDSLTVIWPTGVRQTVANVQVDRINTIEER